MFFQIFVHVRQHVVITQKTTIWTFTSTKPSKSTHHLLLTKLFISPPGALLYLPVVLLSCRLLQLNGTKAIPPLWYLHRVHACKSNHRQWKFPEALCANWHTDENEEVMTGIGDRDFKWADTLNNRKWKEIFTWRWRYQVYPQYWHAYINTQCHKTDHHLKFHCCKNITSHIYPVGFSLQGAAKGANNILDTFQIFLNTES